MRKQGVESGAHRAVLLARAKLTNAGTASSIAQVAMVSTTFIHTSSGRPEIWELPVHSVRVQSTLASRALMARSRALSLSSLKTGGPVRDQGSRSVQRELRSGRVFLLFHPLRIAPLLGQGGCSHVRFYVRYLEVGALPPRDRVLRETCQIH